jgi:hypothetical protein
MQSRFGGRVDFLTVYIKEAHPTDEWQMDANETEGICYPQPRSIADRVRIARDFVKRTGYDIPIVVDEMTNAADDAYAAWPERLYVIGADGRVAYTGATGPFGFHPEEVEAWLERHAGS